MTISSGPHAVFLLLPGAACRGDSRRRQSLIRACSNLRACKAAPWWLPSRRADNIGAGHYRLWMHAVSAIHAGAEAKKASEPRVVRQVPSAVAAEALTTRRNLEPYRRSGRRT